jgi:hypothetical protein
MLPEPKLFQASYMKLKRAKKHFAELQLEVEGYLNSEPLQLVWEAVPWTERNAKVFSPGTKLVGLVAHILHEVPETLAPIIGDVVHNLRSALDIMMSEVVSKEASHIDIRTVGLPCWRGPKSKEGSIGRIRDAGPAIVALVEAWEPYEGGASRLYALSELDNKDKHRSIIPTMMGAGVSLGRAFFAHEIAPETIIEHFPKWSKVVEGQVLSCGEPTGLPPAGTVVKVTPGLALDGDAIADRVGDVIGRELIAELEWHIDVVTGVLFSFESGVYPEFVSHPHREPVSIGNGMWISPPEMSPDDALKFIETDLRVSKA